MTDALVPGLTPQGLLWLDRMEDEFLLGSSLSNRVEDSFARGAGHRLLNLSAGEAESILPPSFAWWRDFGMRFIADLCSLGEGSQSNQRRALPAPVASKLQLTRSTPASAIVWKLTTSESSGSFRGDLSDNCPLSLDGNPSGYFLANFDR